MQDTKDETRRYLIEGLSRACTTLANEKGLWIEGGALPMLRITVHTPLGYVNIVAGFEPASED